MANLNCSELCEIPGVGPSLEKKLQELGYTQVRDLVGENPEAMYQRLMELRGEHVDRCVLYVFRCAVYYAQTPPDRRDPEKLKWWGWKD
ncbi:MAG: helix-hairpin-helix domain-containing protein [Desulfovibrio sp.]|uniref:helix-hairpin-helix domain-containing protein n=1 Tax=Desulfovibrio sp. 7SRBS1 TaxID=3378064 RepID=UPI003B41487F